MSSLTSYIREDGGINAKIVRHLNTENSVRDNAYRRDVSSRAKIIGIQCFSSPIMSLRLTIVTLPLFIFTACVANPGKITLHDAMKDVVNSMYAFEQQEYIRAHPDYDPKVNPPIVFTKMGTYVKEVDVAFNVSASATTQGTATGGTSAAGPTASATLSGTLVTGRGNTITIKFGSFWDNDAFTSGKLKYGKTTKL
jgi:hypothetical protein